MDLNSVVPSDFNWPDPWEPVGDDDFRFERELLVELPVGHVLAGIQVKAIARSKRSDDVVFATNRVQAPIAIVHLTWKGAVELDGSLPWTSTYPNLREALLHQAPG